jgi:CRISPR/Cas system-associated exonuclease Cas4 (RecB family)
MFSRLRRLVADFDQVAAELHEWVNRPTPEPRKSCQCTSCRYERIGRNK